MNMTVRHMSGLLAWKRPAQPPLAKWRGRLAALTDLVVLHGDNGDRDIFFRNDDGVYVPLSSVVPA